MGRRSGSRAGNALVPVRGRAVRYSTTMPLSVPNWAMQLRGWVEVDDESWDYIFADPSWVHEHIPYANPSTGLQLAQWQRVNHFPNHVELTRKDLLAKNLKRARKALEKDGHTSDALRFAFFPTTFVLPNEHAMFVRSFKDNGGGVWIIKPIGRAQGSGIFLVNRLKQVEQWLKERQSAARERAASTSNPDPSSATSGEAFIAQAYISDPYLVAGKKFDLRIFALVLSFSPLKVYLYRDGFARFTSTRFSLEREDLSNTGIHLTNHAVQRMGHLYDASQSNLKWSLQSLKRYMITKHGTEQADTCFSNIQSIVINSLRAVQPVLINDKHCHELYGYDVMIDSSLKPWLVEVNASPSLTSDSPDDYEMKLGMSEDMLCAVDVEGYFSDDTPSTVGGFDLILDNNEYIAPCGEASEVKTMLGCANHRKRQLKRLYVDYAQG